MGENARNIENESVPEDAEELSMLRKVHLKFRTNLRHFFYKLGYYCATHYCKVITAVLAFNIIICVGLVNFRAEDEYENLWIPKNTISSRQQTLIEELFPSSNRYLYMVITGKSKGQDIGNKASLLDLVEVIQKAYFAEENVGLETQCLMIPRDTDVEYCAITSVLDLFYDFEKPSDISFLDNVQSTITDMNDQRIVDVLGNRPYQTWTGQNIDELDIIGGVSRSPTGSITEIQAYRVLFVVKSVERLNDTDLAWESSWIENVKAFTVNNLSVYPMAIVAVQEAADDSLTSDVNKIMYGIGLLAIYVCLTMGEFHRVHSRISLAVMGLISVMLSLISTVSIGSALGMFYGPVHQVLPLLLIGVGIDDAFVIVTALDSIHEPQIDHKVKVAKALSIAGSSITVTSITNSCAFFIGSLTEIPALNGFAIWAGIGVLFDFLYQTTFFVAFLAMDVKR